MAAGTRPAGAVGRADAAGTAGPILAAGTAARADLAAASRPGSPGRRHSRPGSPGRRHSLLPDARRAQGAAGNAASSPPGPRPGWLSFSSSSPRSRASRHSASPRPQSPCPLTRRLLSSRPRHRPETDGPTLAAGVAPLTQLLPSTSTTPLPLQAARQPRLGHPGLVNGWNAMTPAWRAATAYAYQMDSSANYHVLGELQHVGGRQRFLGIELPAKRQQHTGNGPWDDSGSGGSGFYPTVRPDAGVRVFSNTRTRPPTPGRSRARTPTSSP